MIQYVTSVLVFMYEEMEDDTLKDRDVTSLDFAGFKDGQETFISIPTPKHTLKKIYIYIYINNVVRNNIHC